MIVNLFLLVPESRMLYFLVDAWNMLNHAGSIQYLCAYQRLIFKQ